MEQLIGRATIILMWLGLPVLLLVHAPVKYIVALSIILTMSLYAHGCLAIIHRQLLTSPKNLPGILKIIIFGSLEINKLKKQQKILLNDNQAAFT